MGWVPAGGNLYRVDNYIMAFNRGFCQAFPSQCYTRGGLVFVNIRFLPGPGEVVWTAMAALPVNANDTARVPWPVGTLFIVVALKIAAESPYDGRLKCQPFCWLALWPTHL